MDASGTELSRNYLLLAPFYDVTTMQQPELQASAVAQLPSGAQGARTGETPFNVTIQSQAAATAAFVWAETRYDDVRAHFFPTPRRTDTPLAHSLAGWLAEFCR